MPPLISSKKTNRTFFISDWRGQKFVLVFANFKVKLNLNLLFVISSSKDYLHFMLCGMKIFSFEICLLSWRSVWNVKTWQQFLKSTRSISTKSQRVRRPQLKTEKKENKANFPKQSLVLPCFVLNEFCVQSN